MKRRPLYEDLEPIVYGVFGTLAFLAFGAMFLQGCLRVPTPGESCAGQAAFCGAPEAALACREGVVTSYACSGPKGCTLGAGRAVLCDQSKAAAAGTFCFQEYEGSAQCAATEAGAYLQCIQGAWVRNTCPPGRTCHEAGGELSCR